MEFTKGEIALLGQIAAGNRSIKEIAVALKKSEAQVYIYARDLTKKGLTELTRGIIEPKRLPHVSLLLQILSKIPNLAQIVSGPGMPIFTAMLKPSTMDEIAEETGYKKTAIYKRLEEARKRSLVRKKGDTFEINGMMWSELKEFLEEARKYESLADQRIPAGAIMYSKKGDEVVFSSKEELDATKTAFSAYADYGIGLLSVTHFYCLPKKKLTKEDVLRHSLYIVEKDRDPRYLIFIALFYVKCKKRFKIKHQLLKDINAVLEGREIKGFPKYQEIKDRAEVYGITV